MHHSMDGTRICILGIIQFWTGSYHVPGTAKKAKQYNRVTGFIALLS
jgi:hypothetical protein